MSDLKQLEYAALLELESAIREAIAYPDKGFIISSALQAIDDIRAQVFNETEISQQIGVILRGK